ncbi:threonine synthase [Histomonas meleagridis]|uniref:threonine synthase n=1 Tax=Histomonas meleagridis TaxID=135588 RepID=UPI003559D02D|nr:threonine synthase [Histomonas meleagridis]KAH0803271.1 threonine synthase [Histomonas meleagridis]
MFWTHNRSILSGKEYPKDKYKYYAEEEGPKALLSTEYDLKALGASIPNSLKDPSLGMFRYMPFLPIDPKAEIPSVLVGGTPLIPVKKERSPFNFNLWIKDEGRNPSASLKDRASAFVCSKAKELGIETITTASSGNAAAATSVMACNLGLKCVIFVPAHAPPAKVIQNRIFGSKVYLVEGPYDNAVNACMKASAKFGWYNRSTGYNPFTIDGKKTVSFEICEQFAGIQTGEGIPSAWGKLGKFMAPDVICVPVGDGNIVSGVHKGLKELLGAGLIDKMPRIIGIQAEGSNAIYTCWANNGDETQHLTCNGSTCADSIDCSTPNDPIRAVRAARETGGAYIQISDEKILEAIPLMARASGVFPEPASATTWAGLLVAQEKGLVKPGENVVAICTGNGLKDINGATRAMQGKNEAILIKDADEIKLDE